MVIDIPYDSGIYLLEIYLSSCKVIKIGKKGSFSFPAGYYYYAGSAQQSLKARIKRHLSDEKKLHWHIDYLLQEAELNKYYTWPLAKEAECRLALIISKYFQGKITLEGFGASDCNCNSHLFYVDTDIDEVEIDLKLK